MTSRKKENAEAAHDAKKIAGKAAEAQGTAEKPTAFVSVRRLDVSPKPVLRRLLPPLAVIVILLIVGAWELLYQLHRQQLDGRIKADIAAVSGNLHNAMDQQAFNLAIAMQPIAADATVQKALREGDADRLLADWQPVFKMMNRESHLTHFYFFDANRVCMLRVHSPEKHGDIINRFTAIEAERTGKTASGLELGPLGTFTFRVVRPVFEGGTLVGYLELGKEIEDVLQTINTQSGIQLAVVIRKVHLNRQAWEEGMRLLGREADWDRLPRSVVSYASQGRLPAAFASWADYLTDDHIQRETIREITFDGKDWGVFAMPLRDASDKEVGDLLLMRDISISKAAFVRIVALGGTGGAVLLAVLLGLIYVLLRHTDADIQAQQAALKEGEKRHRAILQTAMDGFWVVDMQGRLLEVNESYCRMSGYSAQELVTMRVSDLEATETIADIATRIQKIMVQGEDRFETQHRCKDGSILDIEVSVQNRPTDDWHLVAFLRDITERKQAEAERERLLLAIEQAGDMIVITDHEGAIEYVNPAFETVTGYNREEVIRKNPRILKSGKQEDAFYRNLWGTISSGKTFQGRMVNKRKDGTFFTEEVTISPVRDASGQTVNYVAVKHDITEHLQLTAQFQQAQKMESVGLLAGGVAHDYNNMLSVILGFSGLAMDKVDPADPLHGDLQEIINAGNRATEITRQLLAFARQQTIAPVVLDLNATIEGMLKMLRRLIGEDIDLAWLPDTNLWPVKIDPSQLDQLLANLCVNARDAIADVGRITVETKTVSFDEVNCADHPAFVQGDFVMLAVSDDGCGINKEEKEKIFEPFFTTKELGRGTGLGLATVYGIVKQNNGFINVYSEPGDGTTFKIYLPRYEGKVASAMKEKEAPIPQSKGEMVLVVEDDESILKLAERILQSYSYTVLTANTPGEALGLAERHASQIHLLVTDVVMPEMNGRELAHQMQSLCPNLKTLFMSGYTVDVVARRGVLDEGINFIQKPFSSQALATAVRKVLDDSNTD